MNREPLWEEPMRCYCLALLITSCLQLWAFCLPYDNDSRKEDGSRFKTITSWCGISHPCLRMQRYVHYSFLKSLSLV